MSQACNSIVLKGGMPLYLCHWPNGDCSVVWARKKEDAIIELDQVGNTEGCPLLPLREFQVHFRFTDEGKLEFAM
jgi:hypothetical protein